MQILHTVLEPNQALDAAGESFDWDLPVNPLTAIVFTLRALNIPGATPFANYTASPLSFISKISNYSVQYRGASIRDGDPFDLIQIDGRNSGWWPIQGQLNNTDNDVRSISWALLFGRKAYDEDECFPATRRGDLRLFMDTAADPTGLDGFSLQIETVELLDAAPKCYVKAVSSAQELAAGDVNDLSLPIGNKLLGILLRAGLFPTAASNNAAFNQMALEVDNVEVGYSTILWNGARSLWRKKTALDWMLYGHDHFADYDNAGDGQTGQMEADLSELQRYGYIEFDPTGDGRYALPTRNAADINLHVNASAADTAARIIPVELVELAGSEGG